MPLLLSSSRFSRPGLASPICRELKCLKGASCDLTWEIFDSSKKFFDFRSFVGLTTSRFQA